ncbi:hypothetical protein [Kaistia granuli]|uniref:hypothetical protein n=1 Tax=Kaistia granuli TaxID=363259 RepID=UPI00036E7E1D|nr:hypothetical protein [Kaistia granuli]
MKRTLAALAIVTLAGASAIAVAPAAFAAKTDTVAEASKGGDKGEMKRGPHGGRHAGNQEGRGGRHHGRDMRGHGPHGPRGERMQMWLANNLNAAETLIDIRPDQKDAWRGYTNALLAMFQPPARPDAAAAEADKAPFAREERLIRRSTERAAKAADLQKAIDGLKAKLTPEQLQKLADADLRFGPPMRGPGRDRGPGPDRAGDQAAPDAAPAAPDMPEDDAAPQAE